MTRSKKSPRRTGMHLRSSALAFADGGRVSLQAELSGLQLPYNRARNTLMDDMTRSQGPAAYHGCSLCNANPMWTPAGSKPTFLDPEHLKANSKAGIRWRFPALSVPAQFKHAQSSR